MNRHTRGTGKRFKHCIDRAFKVVGSTDWLLMLILKVASSLSRNIMISVIASQT
jgi:hypothetical protein